MNNAPNKRYASDTAPNCDNVNSNIELNIPTSEINTDRRPLSNAPPIRMKKPSRMRSEDFNGKTDSSAIESNIIASDYRETLHGEGLNGLKRSLFVSAKYNRRASNHSVTFTLPESDKTSGKDFNSSRGSGLLTEPERNYNSTSDDDISAGDFESLAYRRMSAPELPPISTNGKHSSLISNGLTTSRSNTFHNYRFNIESKKNRKSIHSDSSIQGYGLANQSRTSSSSSQQSRARVLSAGAERRPNNRSVPELENLAEIPPSGSNKKIEKSTTKKPSTGMPTMVVPPRSASVMRRNNSKLSLLNQSQKLTTPRGAVLKHANSEGHLNRGPTVETTPRYNRDTTTTKNSMKRISSDKCLTTTETKNSKHSTPATTGNGFTRPAHAHKGTSRSVNGVKKVLTSSKLSSKADEKKSDSGSLERLDYDSDSDSERDRRVKDWIIGVEDAEPPEEPTIEYVEDPPQRDTAIRIVYEGDS